MNRSILVAAIATVLAPTIAHAEYRADSASFDIRPSTKTTKNPGRNVIAKREMPVLRAPATPRTEIDSVLSVDAVLNKISRVYITGLQRCYRKQLASDASVSGKVTMVLSIDAKGNALADLVGINPKLDSCITSAIGKWRFPHVDEPAEATFKLSLLLTK